MTKKRKSNKKNRIIPEVVASITILSLVVYIGFVVIGFKSATFSSVSNFALGTYSFILLMSATKLYGKSVLKAAKDAGSQLINKPKGNINNKEK